MKIKNIFIPIFLILVFISNASAVSYTQVGGTATLNGTKTYDYFNLSGGAVVYIATYSGVNGTLTLNVTYDVNIDATSSINGASRGYRGGSGAAASYDCGHGGELSSYGGGSDAPSCGGDITGGGGGGGYASNGGNGGASNNYAGGTGGTTNGTINLWDINMGNGAGGGGSGSTGAGSSGSAGGAMLRINAGRNISIRGSLTFTGGSGGNGGSGTWGGGGGGGASGGGILLNATNVNITSSTITTAGGSGGGGHSSGGAGSGGRLKIFYINSVLNTSATITSGSTYYENINIVPTVPTIQSPTNNSISYINTTTNINWTQSTDAEGDTITYTWQFSNTSDFSNILNTSTVSVNYSGLITYPLHDYYYMRVRSNDAFGSSIWSNIIYLTSAQLLTLVSPANNSYTSSNVDLIWAEIPLTSYTYQVATDSAFSSVYTSGVINDLTVNLNLPIGTYYWHVKNTTSGYTNWYNFTITAATSQGYINVQVLDEQNYSKNILNFTAELYQGIGSTSFMKTLHTTTGWANFSYATYGITQTEYLVRVIPDNATHLYAERNVLATSPINLTMYVPNSSLPNIIVLDSMKINDLTGYFLYTTSSILIYNNGSLMYSKFFDADGKAPVYLIAGRTYSISIQNGIYITNWGNYVPISSDLVNLVINNFSVNNTALGTFRYNISYSSAKIEFNWNSQTPLYYLNYSVYQGISNTLLCNLNTITTVGQSNCLITNLSDSYLVTVSAHNTEGWTNVSKYIDYRLGTRQDSTGISPVDGYPIGIGFKWDYGTFTMPNWVYNLISVVLIVLLAGTFGATQAALGGVITSITLMLLAVWGWFRPLGDIIDPHNYITMGFCGGLILLSILYYMQHKEKGG